MPSEARRRSSVGIPYHKVDADGLMESRPRRFIEGLTSLRRSRPGICFVRGGGTATAQPRLISIDTNAGQNVTPVAAGAAVVRRRTRGSAALRGRGAERHHGSKSPENREEIIVREAQRASRD